MPALQGAVESTAPVSRLHAHRAEFPVPTGREEEWRFTPLRRLRGLHAAQPLAAGKIHAGVDAAPGVTAVLAPRGDPRHATDFEPADRISATAFASYQEALIVTVPPEAQDTTPTVISVRGDDPSGAAFGHTRISLGDNARAVVVLDHHGSAPLGRANSLSTGKTQNRSYTAAQASGSRVPSMAARATSVRRRLLLRA